MIQCSSHDLLNVISFSYVYKMMGLMDRILRKGGLDLHLEPYRVLATGPTVCNNIALPFIVFINLWIREKGIIIQ